MTPSIASPMGGLQLTSATVHGIMAACDVVSNSEVRVHFPNVAPFSGMANRATTRSLLLAQQFLPLAKILLPCLAS